MADESFVLIRKRDGVIFLYLCELLDGVARLGVGLKIDSYIYRIMALLHADTCLSDAILHDTSLIPVIARFGISLGMGEKSIGAVCAEHGLDTDFFITILNTFINENYFPEKRLQSFYAGLLVDYLTKTNLYYVKFQLPNVERHFGKLVEWGEGENSNLVAVFKFFEGVRKELLARIESDKRVWFPVLRERLQQYDKVAEVAAVADLPPTDTVEEKLNDLLSLIVRHLSGDYDINLCHAVIFALCSLRNDIKQHNRIRNRILRPVAAALQCDSPVISV